MAKPAFIRTDEKNASAEAERPTDVSQEEQKRQNRRLALERLRGIGWDGDLEAMRLGLADHSAK